MKRGFLNSKKAQREALYPPETLTGLVSAPSVAQEVANHFKSGVTQPLIMKAPHGKVENTALPASYTPAKFPTFECHPMESNHPANAALFTTIPARFTGQPPDPDGHSEWIVSAPTKSKVLNAPGYPQPVPKPTANVKSHVVKATPTMGKGVFATRDIRMGEIIFAERPLLVVPRALRPTTKVNLSEYSIADYMKIMLFQREQQLEVAVERMEPDRRARLMALMNSHLEDGSGPLSGIVRTNGYGVTNLWDGDVRPDEDGSSPHYYGVVCDVGSRINHSCRPNICHVFKLSAFAMVFFAARDIKAGEQLFYSYCGMEQSASQRKAELAPYGITQCICASCVNATPETDALRKTFNERVQEYRRQRAFWQQLPRLPVEILDDLLKFQRAVVEEGLDTDHNYWLNFLTTLTIAYKMSDRTNEASSVVEKMMKWHDFLKFRQAMESSQ